MLTCTFPDSDWLEFEGAFDLFVCSHWLQGHIVHHIEINDVTLLSNQLERVSFFYDLEIRDASQKVQQDTPAFLIVYCDHWLVVEDDAVFGDADNLDLFDLTVGLFVVFVEYLGA